MELEIELVEHIISDMFVMCEQHRLVGIPAYMTHWKSVPVGWWLHPYTQYYLPPNYSQQNEQKEG